MFEKTLGDTHNFGRKVVFGEYQGIQAVFKPRTTYWEAFFFSEKGILQCFETTNLWKDIQPLLQIEELGKNDGFEVVRRLFPIENNLINDQASNLWRQYACLSAVCCLFGITDILSENLIVTEKGLCAIDIESVFHITNNAFDTGVLVGRNSLPFMCGLAAMPRVSNWKDVLLTFEKFFLTATEKQKCLNDYIQDHFEEMKQQAIRTLIRNTFHYATGKDDLSLIDPDQTKLDLLPEEKIQLKRGDIPYFFKKIGTEGLYCYTTKDLKNIEKVNQDPSYPLRIQELEDVMSKILDIDLMVNEVLPRNLLQWVDNLMFLLPEKTITFPIQLENYSIDLEGELLSVKSNACEWIMTTAVHQDGQKQIDPRLQMLKDPAKFLKGNLLDLHQFDQLTSTAANFLLMRVR